MLANAPLVDVWVSGLALWLDRLTAILELAAPFILPLLAVELAALCVAKYCYCRELERELSEAAS